MIFGGNVYILYLQQNMLHVRLMLNEHRYLHFEYNAAAVDALRGVFSVMMVAKVRVSSLVQSRFAETRFAETRFAETPTLTLTLNPNP